MMSLLLVATVSAQEKSTKDSISSVLKEKLELALKAEKELMKEEIIKINEQVENNEISKERAGVLKKEIANKYAVRIKEKTNIISNSKVGKNNDVQIHFYGKKLFKIMRKNDSIKKKPRKKDFRTYSGIVFATGGNSLLKEGESLNDFDYTSAKSNFYEIGLGFKTRVFKESNWLRFGYGMSLQYNNIGFKANQYLVRNNNITSLQIHPYHLKKSKIRITNLVVPLTLEFGTSEKINKGDYSIFSNYQKFKFVIGGYVGVRLGTIQKLKYNIDGHSEKVKVRNSYNMNNFVYGLSAGIAYNSIGLYTKYDLNPLFSSPNAKQNVISLGLKFELF